MRVVALPPFVAESAPLSHDAHSCREFARAPHCHPTLMRERVETVCVCFVARAVAPVHYLALHCNCASLVGRIPPFSGKGVSLYQRGPPRHAHASPTPRLAPDAPVHSDAAAPFSCVHRSAIASVFPLDWRRYMSPSPLPFIRYQRRVLSHTSEYDMHHRGACRYGAPTCCRAHLCATQATVCFKNHVEISSPLHTTRAPPRAPYLFTC